MSFEPSILYVHKELVSARVKTDLVSARAKKDLVAVENMVDLLENVFKNP